MLLALIMCLSTLPVGVFAGNESAKEKQAAEQIEGGTNPVYYTYDAQMGIWSEDGSTDSWVFYEDGKVQASKSIQPTGVENEFQIDLTVKTSEEISKLSASTATVLVMDMSNSMQPSWENSNGNDEGESRDDWAREAAKEFLDTYYVADAGNGARRMVSIVEFGSNAKTVYNWHDVQEEGGLEDAKDAVDEVEVGFKRSDWELVPDGTSGAQQANRNDIEIDRHWSIFGFYYTWECKVCGASGYGQEWQHSHMLTDSHEKDEGATNIHGGLQLAYNLINEMKNDPAFSDIQNFHVILLTDGQPTQHSNNNETSTAYIESAGGGNSKANEQDYSRSVVAAQSVRQVGTLHTIYLAKSDSNFNESGSYSVAFWPQTVKNYLSQTIGSSNCNYMVGNLNGLKEAFENINSVITMLAEAWMIHDPMGDNIQFVDWVDAGTRPTDRIVYTTQENGQTNVVWDIKKDNPSEIDPSGNITWYTYRLSYTIRLDTTAQGFVSKNYGLTNGVTILTYALSDENGSITGSEGRTAYLKVPKVQGYLGKLTFDKVDAYRNNNKQEPLPIDGAGFTLHPDGVDGTAKDKFARSVNGIVEFTYEDKKENGIPSGFTYTLSETQAAEGYVCSDVKYQVTVEYGEVYVKAFNASGNPTGDELYNNGALEFEVTNELDPKNATVTVKKDWNLLEGSSEVNVTIQLWKINGVKDTTPGTSNGNGDTADELAATVEIPAGEESAVASVATVDIVTGEKCAYYAVETSPSSGYAVSDTGSITPANVTSRTITVTNVEQGKRDITISKEWDTVSSFKQEATLVLLRNGEIYDTVQLTGNSSEEFEDLPRRDTNGTNYEYSVAEWVDTNKDGRVDQNELVYNGGTFTDVDGHTYRVTISDFTVTNTFEPDKITISGTKQWVDGNNAENTRPETVMVQLLKDGAPTGGEMLIGKQAGGTINWSYQFVDLPEYEKVNGAWKKLTYTVTDSCDDYTPTPGTTTSNLSNKITQKTITVDVEKVWNDSGVYTLRPDTVVIQLYRDDVSMGDDYKATFQAEEDGTWSDSLTASWNVDKYNPQTGSAYTYTVKEVGVDEDDNLIVNGKDTNYDCEVTGGKTRTGDYDFTVTNTLNGDTKTITVYKHWVDVNGSEASRPDVFITLNNNSQYSHTFTGADVVEEYTFTVPKYADGKEITYTASESGVTGTAYTSQQVGFHFYNYLTETNDVTVSGTKSWENNGVTNPDSATIILQSDAARQGVYTDVTGKTAVVNGDNQWSFSFTGLPKYAYTYTGSVITGIREISYQVIDNTPNYTVSGGTAVTKEGITTYDLTNTFQQGYVSIPVIKTWVDGNGTGRPDSVSVALFRDGEQIDTANLTEENGWTCTFGSENGTATLPKYKDNQKTEYEYKVYEMNGENKVENGGSLNGYTVTYTGTYQNAIQNKNSEIGQTTGSASITKSWVAPWSELPASVTFKLYRTTDTVLEAASAEYVQDVVLNKPVVESKAWSETVWNLPIRDESGYVYTYFFEEVTDGLNGYAITHNDEKTHYTNTIAQDSSVIVSGAKTWVNAPENSQPDSIRVQLYRNGVSMGDDYNVEVTAANNWSYTFENLDKYNLEKGQEGEPYKYTVQEGYYADNGEGVKTWYAITDGSDITFYKPTGNYTFTASYNSDGTAAAGTIICNVVNTYKEVVQYLYRVDRVYNYYVDGVLNDAASSKVIGTSVSGTKGQVVTISETDSYKSTDGKNEYTFVSGTPVVGEEGAQTISVTLDATGEYVITLTYEYRYTTPTDPGTGGGGGGGWTPPTPDPDPDEEIPDEETPLNPNPDDEVIDIDEGETPMGDGSGLDDGTEIIDENETPLGNLPQTGAAEAVNPFATAGFMALAASMAAAGLVLTRTKSGKREED